MNAGPEESLAPQSAPLTAFGSRGLDFDGLAPLAPRTYDLPDLPREKTTGRLEQVAISILRLDARLKASGLSAALRTDAQPRSARRHGRAR
jgi:hypothetical protein